MFDDRTIPDQYQQHLRDIFPDRGSGCFTYQPQLHKWVWTTFYTFQWDLNYANPVVFIRMLEEMLFLANAGVEVLRLDAVAFIWKQMGTNSENLPEAHMLIQAFNALARIAAPSLLFKSEAIVHPDEVVKYISPTECQLSYNPLLMALLWNSLATREIRMLAYSMQERFRIHPGCAWVNYVRVHDDIGWTFSDEDAARLGINGFDHRRFLNAFYSGRFPGSFARGLPFQENPRTGDARISGTLASLAGLEKALQEENEAEIELAIRRILLLHSIILSIGGIPLIYLGDEVGLPNDYNYRSDPAKAKDSRWVHRPVIDWAGPMARRNQPETVEGRINGELRRLIELRKQHAALANGEMEVIPTGNDHVFGYVRRYTGKRLLVLANFTEQQQSVAANEVRLYGLGYTFTDVVSGQTFTLAEDLKLEPYQFVWLVSPTNETALGGLS
jgi:amylosucrase